MGIVSVRFSNPKNFNLNIAQRPRQSQRILQSKVDLVSGALQIVPLPAGPVLGFCCRRSQRTGLVRVTDENGAHTVDIPCEV